MPIKISCRCGKALTIPDQMSGKAVKCPSCGQALKVPGSAGPAVAAAPATSGRMVELFDEEGFSQRVEAICPVCRAEMAAGAVLCTKCGYHKELGAQFESHKTAGVDIDHGTLALMKAEQDLIKDREMQHKLVSGAGMPWWGLALVLFILGSGLTIAVLAVNASRRVDESITFNPLGLFLMLSAVAFTLVALGAYWMIVLHGFRTNGKKGLLVLIPPYAFYYVYLHLRDTWRYLLAAIVLGGIAGGLFAAASSQGI
jgi:hypothetical protein